MKKMETPARAEAGSLFAPDAQLENDRRLREAEAARDRLQALLVQSPVAICVLEGPQHTFTFANPAYCALVDNRDLVGKPLLEALPDIRGQGFDTLLTRVMTTEESYFGNEVPAKLAHHADGESLIVNFVYTPKRNGEGVVDGVLVTATDVTEQVRARNEALAVGEQLRKSEERLRRVVDASGTATWEMDLPSQSVTADARFRCLFGLSHDEPLTLEKCVACIHPDDIPHVTEIVTSAMAGKNGGRYIDEYRLRPSAGKPVVWIESRGQLRFDADEKPVRLHGTVLEVTDRKAAEAEVHQRADFERQLIGIVSHDLRNPVGAIVLGAAVLLRGEELSERQTKIAVRIQNSAARANRMIRDLLDFTQARLAGGIQIETREMNLHETIDSVLEEVEATYAGREVRVRRSGDARGEWDPDRIAQVVQNLVTNALKYSPDGSPVTVGAQGEDANVVLMVHNEGTPIPADRLDTLFRPLERATSDVDKTGRSIGLGLYIVKEVVDAHGGSVSVESTSEAGTTFTVRLARASARGRR